MATTTTDFLSSVEEIRARARQRIEEGAVTPGYGLERDLATEVLNHALATEILCVLRYKRHYHATKGSRSQPAAEEFLEHAADEQEHADRIAERITQLGGEPNFEPDGLSARSHSEFGEAKDLAGMLREDLIAERVAIESYGEMIRFFGEHDPTTRRMLEEILETEEEHADDLADLIADLP